VRRLPLLALACVSLVDCGAPPWQLGRPLDGSPSIPPERAIRTPAQSAAAAAEARASGRRVLELAALLQLDTSDKLTVPTRGLTGPERARLVELLVARAAEFHALGRSIPESADLETVARLDAARGVQLVPARAVASAAAGDAWKAIGAREEARAAYLRAAALGGVRPGELGIVPRRAAVPAPAGAGQPPADVEGYVLSGASLSARLLPLVAQFPWLLDQYQRAMTWAELLLAEDPTSPDVLEVVALIWGKARRFGGTERMLMELAYHTPDRAAGLARGAAVWERVGRPREACAQWIRAARWRDDPEDPLWRNALACARRDPGAGDAKAIRDYVVSRARPERRELIAAELDGRPVPAPDGGAPAVDAGVADGGAADGGALDAGTRENVLPFGFIRW
jgi:tetratricopeptide (TPR) repeat protein